MACNPRCGTQSTTVRTLRIDLTISATVGLWVTVKVIDDG